MKLGVSTKELAGPESYQSGLTAQQETHLTQLLITCHTQKLLTPRTLENQAAALKPSQEQL